MAVANHRQDDLDAPGLEPASVGARRSGEKIGVRPRGIFREEGVSPVVEAGGHEVRIEPECGENFARVGLVLEGERRGGVCGDDLSPGRETRDDGLAKRQFRTPRTPST